MNRYIKDPMSVSYSDLQNLDWDIIELGITVDTEKLRTWFDEIEEKFKESKFVVSIESEKKYYRPDILKKWYVVNPAITGTDFSRWWMLNWAVERYDPLPSPSIANPQLFPEITDPNYRDSSAPFLERYQFGAFKSLCNSIGEYLKLTRAFVIPEGSGIRTHIDNKYPNIIIRMHIEVDINDQATWFFGEMAEREYVLEPGKVYLVNTAVTHAAINFGKNDWRMIYGTPLVKDIDKVLQLSGKV
jgi:hypothetical protein